MRVKQCSHCNKTRKSGTCNVRGSSSRGHDPPQMYVSSKLCVILEQQSQRRDGKLSITVKPAQQMRSCFVASGLMLKVSKCVVRRLMFCGSPTELLQIHRLTLRARYQMNLFVMRGSCNDKLNVFVYLLNQGRTSSPCCLLEQTQDCEGSKSVFGAAGLQVSGFRGP